MQKKESDVDHLFVALFALKVNVGVVSVGLGTNIVDLLPARSASCRVRPQCTSGAGPETPE